jgi:uncharacterized phiE125 gp8 family phage protein
MPSKLIVAPIAEPLTPQHIMQYLRIDDTGDESGFIVDMIPAARQYVEEFCGRALMTQTWNFYFQDFIPRDRRFMTGLNYPGSNVPIPYGGSSRWAQQWPLNSYLELSMPPTQSVGPVTYVDVNGVTQTLDPSIYLVDLVSEPARIYLAPGKIWPPYTSQRNAICVPCVCGYASAALVPARIKLAIKMVIANFYENREPVSLVPGTQPYEMPLNIAAILAPYITERF